MSKNVNARKKGPGRKPMDVSKAHYNMRNESDDQLAQLPADKPGAKLFRAAAEKLLTVRH